MVQPTLCIRKVTPSDIQYAEQATNVVNKAYRSEGGWTTEMDIVGGERCTVKDMIDFINTSGKPNTLLFALEEDQVIGTVQIQCSITSEKEEVAAEIGLFSVTPTHQSRGIGGQLIRAALVEMQTQGFHFAIMHVLENRPEILRWYKKLGFIETGERVPFVWPEMLKVKKDLCFLTLKKELN
ncbi:acyl-CoA N-acyltransferase [Cokeromyces recurvatus]|uniref:acyl-CoA N-acyltransferase n=1 Tax=Cokeromyces recurvatus TaxID=90255 RepID=UPI00221E83C5|nr:acyl-CoA N-acyltransferase [Cokeromyces recurvatus]KAI7899021.1 acyl-CoA N-acyltransferase [Cokeromyces recurvatus]